MPTSRLMLLWRFARPRLPRLAIGLVLGLAVSAMSLVSPLATKWVLDSVSASTSLAGPIGLLSGLLVVGAVLSWFQWVLLGTLAEDIVYDARDGMIRRFLRARITPLLARPAGELVTRVTSDSVLLREAASSSIIGLLNGVVMLVGTLVLMAVLDVPLVLTTVVVVGVVVAIFAALMPAIGTAQERSQAALGSLGGALEGVLRAVRTIKAAGAEDQQLGLLLGHAAESRTQSVRAVRREALVWTVAWAGIQGAIIVILGFGAWRVAQGDMSVSTLIAFLLYAFGLLGPITELSENLTTLQSGLAAAGRISEVEEIEVETTSRTFRPRQNTGTGNRDHTAALERMARSLLKDRGPVLELVEVTARYPQADEPAVKDVSLSIPRRGHTAIVGPSGAGKTTVLSLLLRFVDPESGQMLLEGRPFEEYLPRDLRRRMAYVEQEAPTVPGTIRDNLLLINSAATDTEIDHVLDRIMLSDKIAALPQGLDTPLGQASVSGGQRQRIALARALLANPAVLILDEATAQVDGRTEAAIHAVIREHAQRAAVVTVAHRLSTVMDADQIIVMDKAGVAARGTHDELLLISPLYQELVKALRIA